MELNEKLQELRKRKGITQDELAKRLYVSRTAISKWESGKGYPSIDSLKAIATFFSITIDELVSSNEIISIAEDEKKHNKEKTFDLLCGVIDICAAFLLFLPLFAERSEYFVRAVSLFNLELVHLYLKILYFAVTVGSVLFGVMMFILQDCDKRFWVKIKSKLSLALGVISVLLFIMSLQPYAAFFSFVLLFIKTIMIIKLK